MPLIRQNPGRLDRRITLRYPADTRNDLGESVAAWIESGTVWASWLPQGGREFRAAQSLHADATGVFRIRHRTDVDQTWQLVHGDDVWQILAPLEVGRRNYLDLICRAIDQSPGTAEAIVVLNIEMLHDATPLLLHDSSYQLLHPATDAVTTIEILHDGTAMLLHDGSNQNLHAA